MGTPVGRVIADAGPLIHLFEVQSLDALQVFSSILVPEAVWRETVGTSRVTAQDVETLPSVERIDIGEMTIEQFVERHALQHLQVGECACLVLMDRSTPLWS